MKKVIQLISIILILAKVSASTISMDKDPYLSDNIISSVKNISISKLLDFKKIASAIHDEFDKARFYYIIAYEIDTRLKNLDNKFYSREKDYHRIIKRYEDELDLTTFEYTDERPRFDYNYIATEITDETIYNDIHRIQAELARTQFIQVYKYYRKRLDNYKNYLTTLRELYACKVQENNDEQVEFYSNFQQMYQGIRLFNDEMDDAGKMQVHRDVLGKVIHIDWNIEGEPEKNRRRDFKYHSNGTLIKITDQINNKTVYETLFGEHEMGESFLDYIFSSGFISRDFNYYTEIYYKDGKPSAYKFSTTNNDHVIGTIYREYNEKDHLVKEAWCKGETSKLLREFSSIFDPSSGGYKLIERDKNGKIVSQEIVLSSND